MMGLGRYAVHDMSITLCQGATVRALPRRNMETIQHAGTVHCAPCTYTMLYLVPVMRCVAQVDEPRHRGGGAAVCCAGARSIRPACAWAASQACPTAAAVG